MERALESEDRAVKIGTEVLISRDTHYVTNFYAVTSLVYKMRRVSQAIPPRLSFPCPQRGYG